MKFTSVDLLLVCHDNPTAEQTQGVRHNMHVCRVEVGTLFSTKLLGSVVKCVPKTPSLIKEINCYGISGSLPCYRLQKKPYGNGH